MPLDALPDAITLLLSCARSEALALAAHRAAAAAAATAAATDAHDATSTMGASAVPGALDATSTRGASAVPGAPAEGTAEEAAHATAVPGAPAEGAAEEAAHATAALGDFLSEELTGAVSGGVVPGTFAALALQPLARRPARGVNEFLSLLLGCLMTNGATAELLHRSSAALLELLEVKNCMLIAL